MAACARCEEGAHDADAEDDQHEEKEDLGGLEDEELDRAGERGLRVSGRSR